MNFVNGSGGVVLDSTYKAYAVVVSNAVPQTDATSLRFRTSTNAGVSYDSGAADYDHVLTVNNSSSGTASDVNSAGTANIQISAASGNAAGESFGGTLLLFNPSGTNKTLVMFDFVGVNATPNTYYHKGAGSRLSAADVDAISFFMSAGNISGTFTLYGLKEA